MRKVILMLDDINLDLVEAPVVSDLEAVFEENNIPINLHKNKRREEIKNKWWNIL